MAYREIVMDLKPREPEPVQPRGDHIVAIIAKSIGLAAVIVSVAWAITGFAMRFF